MGLGRSSYKRLRVAEVITSCRVEDLRKTSLETRIAATSIAGRPVIGVPSVT